MSERHTQQPEALRLADALRDGEYSLYQERNATEAELRRLHARVQELEASQARVPLSGSGLAYIGAKHFGNPIPREWYSAARDLETTHGITQEKHHG